MKTWLIRLAAVAALTIACASSVHGENRFFPWAQIPGEWETDLHLVNPSAEKITGIAPYGEWGATFLIDLEPHSVAVVVDWPGAGDGGGISFADIPAGVGVYVEIRNVHGNVVEIGDLGPAGTEPVQMLDLKGELEGFVSYVFVTASTSGALEITTTDGESFVRSRGFLFRPGETVILPLEPQSNRVIVRRGFPGYPPAGGFHAFAFSTKQPTGEILLRRVYSFEE